MKSETPRQPDLGRASKMHQSRISMLETAGANPTIGTLSQIAAGLKVGLKVEFVSFSEMLAWENEFSQDDFNPTKIDEDQAFLNPPAQVPVLQPQPIDTSWITVGFLRRLTGGYPQAIWKFQSGFDVMEEDRDQIPVFNDLPLLALPKPQPEFGDVMPWMIDKRQLQLGEDQPQ